MELTIPSDVTPRPEIHTHMRLHPRSHIGYPASLGGRTTIGGICDPPGDGGGSPGLEMPDTEPWLTVMVGAEVE
jgi:hypothetical protein